jgi:hypothetical protein
MSIIRRNIERSNRHIFDKKTYNKEDLLQKQKRR